MKYTKDTKPGMGDPYWYEYSVGLKYIVEMLNPDNNIMFVEMQADVPLGLDDVVITYKDGRSRFIQVKHTRVNDTLTFGDLVNQDSAMERSGSKKQSLLGELAKSWVDAKAKYIDTEIYIFTNRTIGNRVSAAGPGRSIKRPPLDIFWKELQEKIGIAVSFSDIQFPEYNKAWDEWCKQLEDIKSNESKLEFLRNLHIETDRENLNELGELIKNSLRDCFSCSDQVAELLFGKLDHALRKWTTSLRSSSKIDIEDVYTALSLNEETITYNHNLIPSDPFFSSRNNLVSDLEAELKEGDNKVIFLSGVPGTGKTNIISKLCCKKESVVDIRYYAYEPIDPGKEYLPADVTRRVNAEVFWDTMLNQLRALLSGKLYKYRVPILNDFLSLEQKRNEFFRIASEYAYDEQRSFIIAIDGLDHAARSGYIEDTFLPTLPHPEYIPCNIKILIAGQPKEVYPKYPDWLRKPTEDIKEFIVPGIEADDIHDLVKNKCSDLGKDQVRLITDIVCRYAEGNTLSAIFAVHEAMHNGDPVILEQQLQARKLSGNIQLYYEAIWEEAKRNMGPAFVDYKIAGVFAFFNEPISADKLRLIFPEECISKSSWDNILKALSPLLLKQNGSYTILHNDVRVYLSSFIGLDQDHVREVYSDLADYYINISTKSEGYYRDVIRFLFAADRGNEFEKVYSSKYILSAYVYGIELKELRAISDSLLRIVIGSEDLDWNQLRTLSMGYMTIDQIEKSVYEIEEVSFRQKRSIIAVHPYECYVVPEKKWNYKVLLDVLQLICNLFENGEIIRGRTLFHNWFSNLSFSRFEKVVSGIEEGVQSIDLKQIAGLIGRACVYVEEYTLLSVGKTESKISSRFEYEVIEEVIHEAFNLVDTESFSTALDSLPVLLVEPIIQGIKILIKDSRFEDLRRLENSLSKRNINSDYSRMLYAFLQIINGTALWTDDEEDELLMQIRQMKLPEDLTDNLMSYYTIYAIVLAYLCRGSRSSVANEVTERYIGVYKYKKPHYFLLYFNCACYLGKWLKARNKKAHLYDSIDDLINIIENLFHKKWSPNDTDWETYSLRAYILKGFILLAKGESDDFQSTFGKEVEHILEDNPVNQLLDPGLMFFSNNIPRVQYWVDSCLAENGSVWSEPIGERNRIVKQFIESVSRYDKTGAINLRGAEEKVKWSVIGFASHKEYTVNILLNWYNILVDFNESYISGFGRAIKDMSDIIELVGDNRLEYIVNCKVYSDWGHLGTSNVQNILNEQRYLCQGIENPEYLVEILIGYLKNAKLSRQQFLTIWGLGIGLLDWKNEDHHATIYALQKAIEIRASEIGILNIRDDLIVVGPAYMDMASNPIKYIVPDRWFNTEDVTTKVENALDIVEAYLNAPIERTKTGDVLSAIKFLYSKEELTDELSEKIMKHELQLSEYSVYNNSILEFVVGKEDDQSVNKAISSYFSRQLDSGFFNPSQDLPAIITWRAAYKGEDYTRNSVKELLDTYRCWITANNHIKEPDFQQIYNYSESIDLKNADIVEIFLQILLIIVKSEDADAARVALGGLFAVIRNDTKYISVIEARWNEMHYRAKEWLLMLYELCFSLVPDVRNELENILSLHSHDDDFNVALYAKILHDIFYPDNRERFVIDEKDYFQEIPAYGTKRLIKIDEKTQWITGGKCVLEQIALLENRLLQNLDDLEYRTAEYEYRMDPIPDLISLHRYKNGGYKVVCDKVNMSFYRVLYKDWHKGRWCGHEMDLARCILSASEPYYLMVSPQRWKWNDGKLFDDVEGVLQKDDENKKIIIEKTLNEGLDTDEIIIAGSVLEYTYKNELFGYLLSFFEVPFIKPQNAAHRFERNSRLLLIRRDDFCESKHLNISLHHNGIESFKNSNIMCGISRFALSTFGWSVAINSGGAILLNKENSVIGRMEYYYGIRTDMGIRYPGNQPLLQRWVVTKNELSKALAESKCPFSMRQVVDYIVNDSKEV